MNVSSGRADFPAGMHVVHMGTDRPAEVPSPRGSVEAAVVPLAAAGRGVGAETPPLRGEELLARRLDALASTTVRVLHRRRIPGRRTVIDHLAVTARGVQVIVVEHHRGRPAHRVSGGIRRPRSESLVLDSVDRTDLVTGVRSQVDVVRRILGPDVPVTGSLCFLDADWPRLRSPFVVDGVQVVWPRRLAKGLTARGAFGQFTGLLHDELAKALPPA